MTGGRARGGCARWRAVLASAALLPLLGCAGWNPLSALGGPSDPMRAELERLEREQRRLAREGRLAAEAEEALRAEQPETLEEKLLRGDSHLAAGRMAEALWDYASAHRLDPRAAAPRVRLGYVHLRHAPERAQPLFESALALEPEDVSAHIGLGLALLAGGERAGGIAHLERAVALAPDSAKAHAALGVSLDQIGQPERAMTHLERAHALRPRDARILNNLGMAHLRAGAPERAEELFRAALREDSRDERLRGNNLGMALAMQGRFEEALTAFRRVGGGEQDAQSNLGYAHYLRGEYDAAIEHFERALVAGGEASVQVVRNLEAARRAQRVGLAPPGGARGPVSPSEPGSAPAETPVAADERPARDDLDLAGGAKGDRERDPWLWQPPASEAPN